MKSPATLLMLVIVMLASGLGYLAGKQGFTLNNPLESPAPSPLPTLTPSPTPVIPSPTPLPFQTVSGGGVMNFPRYRLTLPSDWTYTKESQTENDQKLTLEKPPYKITIQQGGFGGSACLYPGDASIEGPAGHYTDYVEFTTTSGDKLRRGTPKEGNGLPAGQAGYGICQLTQYGWGAPTLYGSIGLTVPDDISVEALKIIDGILASLTKL